MTRIGTLVLPGVLVLGWLLLSAPGGLNAFEALAGFAAVCAGFLAGALWPRLHRGAGRAIAAADDLLGDGVDGPTGSAGEEESEGDAVAMDEAAAPASLTTLLIGLKEFLGASRVVLWGEDADGGRLIPEDGTPPLPGTVPAAGSPLRWALQERSPVRLDPVPRWARGTIVAVPVDDGRVLTVETPNGEAPDHAALHHAAALLGPFLRLHDQQLDVVAAAHRFDRLVEYLRSLPRERDPALMPLGLARTAMEITDGTGALVASWSGAEGRVLAREGTGGGPRPGTRFAILDGDLSHAARAQSKVVREPGDATRPDLASPEESWERPPPRSRAVFPLVDPRGQTTGLVAVWGKTPPARQGVVLLEAVGPLLALQLRQASDMEELRDRATLDALTGLSNRATLESRLAEEGARFHRHRRPTAVLVVDLDHFKRINDSYGHDAGDAVLRRVGKVLEALVRDVDFPARFGGEEFVVLLPETMLRPALDVAERIRAGLEARPVEVEGKEIPVTASIGVSACPDCVEDPADLFASADQALYAAKNAGRNQVSAAPGRVVSGGAGG